MVKTVLATAAVAALVLSSADAHGNLIRVTGQSGSAGPMGQNSLRDGIPRGDSSIPGPVESFRCDWCVMENRQSNPSINGEWWTQQPAAHWDNPNTQPTIPCMSFDDFGQRGVMDITAGETLDFQMYVNADHGGFYRYEFSNGTSPSSNDFMENPISPWYSLHESAETSNAYPGRVVGYSKADTDAYIFNMNRVPGGGLGGDRKNGGSQNPDSSFCQSNFDNCFFSDRVTVPTSIPSGAGVLRWNWYSMETGQVYTNCIDVSVGGGGAPNPPGSPTAAPPAPTPSPPAPTPATQPDTCTDCWMDNSCSYWCGRAFNEGCAAVGCTNSDCDFC
jgi:hypothetical protein